MTSRAKKIWIDLDNSPHVPFFKPIIEELDTRGYTVMLTARDRYQVCGLADLFGLRYRRVGRSYGKNKLAKLLGLSLRALQLVPVAWSQRPNLALSHGSRSQTIVASILRIPLVVIMDYEHSEWLPFARVTRLIVPEVVYNKVRKNGERRFSKYPGIKEDVYVPAFQPDPSILYDLGINERELVVTVRPPATEAHYHNPESEKLFEAVMSLLCSTPEIRVVLLPRSEQQLARAKKRWPMKCANGKIVIPEQVVDGLNLIWHSDLVISGGGTMNREAAALGVPVYSIFRGEIGAVDRYLADTGRLILIENPEDVHTKIALAKRNRSSNPGSTDRPALHSIVDAVVTTLDGCG